MRGFWESWQWNWDEQARLVAPLRGQAGPCGEAMASWPAHPVARSSPSVLRTANGEGRFRWEDAEGPAGRMLVSFGSEGRRGRAGWMGSPRKAGIVA